MLSFLHIVRLLTRPRPTRPPRGYELSEHLRRDVGLPDARARFRAAYR